MERESDQETQIRARLAALEAASLRGTARRAPVNRGRAAHGESYGRAIEMFSSSLFATTRLNDLDEAGRVVKLLITVSCPTREPIRLQNW